VLVHLVRHASHDLLGRVLVGRGPVPINATGDNETASVCRSLAGLGLAAVISSPQERAVQMAAAIGLVVGLAPTIDPGLDEMDMGEWTGRSFNDLPDDRAWQAFNIFRSSAPIPGGETMLAVQARAVAVLIRLRLQYPDASVALVSHSDVLKSILMHFLGMPLDLIHRFDLAPASRSILELYERDAVVRAINLPAL
jgi:broad specificity phosphatase PhoE